MRRTKGRDGVFEKFGTCSVKLRLDLPLNNWPVRRAKAFPDVKNHRRHTTFVYALFSISFVIGLEISKSTAFINSGSSSSRLNLRTSMHTLSIPSYSMSINLLHANIQWG